VFDHPVNAGLSALKDEIDTGVGQILLQIRLLDAQIPRDEPIALDKKAEIRRRQITGELKLGFRQVGVQNASGLLFAFRLSHHLANLTPSELALDHKALSMLSMPQLNWRVIDPDANIRQWFVRICAYLLPLVPALV
jgi:hypothetical protein